MPDKTTVLRVLSVFAITIAALALLLVVPEFAVAQDHGAEAAANPEVTKWALFSAAIAAGLATLAAGYAVASVGSAAIGAIAEKPELLGRVIILVGLAEGIAIYGLIMAILILNRAG
ncbi:V-type ATP synthase subunit K [Rhodovulum sp. P5]|uniref:ATP synthase subunit C n=1 Tax=Rhodovulum sp. P5 TaxID=1564506 RepID=UPI0009C341A9|nr:ATP synthase subunit C [Rhodovulum sp. P5]ARE40985.1 V-type ATP synthase subunit K [Rhodovulum sp. P5]